MGCISWLVLAAVAVFVMVSLLRWFEQTSDAVERRDWNKTALLVVMPFAVWLYPSKVAAGRPTAVPRHEPVKGFGKLPKAQAAGGAGEVPAPARPAGTRLPGVTDEPPPGTPKEFLGMPVVPPKAAASRPTVDPEKLARLRQKMREQGMLGDDE